MAVDIFEDKGIKFNKQKSSPVDIFEDKNINFPSASEELIKKAQEQVQPSEIYKPQPQEEFSNPTVMPGFQQLPIEEQKQRIALSQFAPSNFTPTGTAVPPGTYENPVTRFAASIAPTLVQPELSLGKGMISHYAINPLLNLAARIGMGTAGTMGYNLPQVQNKEDLKNLAQKSLQLNTLLELPATLARTPGYIGELLNPIKYTQNKLSTIKTEYEAAKALEKETFKPVFDQYGNDKVSIPKLTKNEKLYFTPKVTKAYNALNNEPTVNNLHKFQSAAGSERINYIGREPSRAAFLKSVQEKSIGELKDYLSKDPIALEQFNKARNITKNVRTPFEATPTLKKIATGKISDRSPEAVKNAIRTGTEKLVGEIPVGHALRNHLIDLEKVMNFSKMNKALLPTVAGGITGELLHPGLFGAAAGATGGLGTAAGLFTKIGDPMIGAVLQNPILQNVFSKGVSPLYYGIGRSSELKE